MTSETSTPGCGRPSRTRTTLPVTLAGAAALLLALTACGGSGTSHPATGHPDPLPSPTSTAQRMSAENLGYTWPLTVDHGTAECRKGTQAVFTAPDGTAYALNDRARDAGYHDIGPLRAKGDDGDPISLGSLLSKTLKLCRAAG
ncbi:DUF2511 domain-containing protein [Streptomyces sp. NPDC014006]|uniref:DUF2511 domain-containing protein n=1 Tax=Streptomyces sp. NPDC014006 TaxID=3364870 RepID=UPI003702137B